MFLQRGCGTKGQEVRLYCSLSSAWLQSSPSLSVSVYAEDRVCRTDTRLKGQRAAAPEMSASRMCFWKQWVAQEMGVCLYSCSLIRTGLNGRKKSALIIKLERGTFDSCKACRRNFLIYIWTLKQLFLVLSCSNQ